MKRIPLTKGKFALIDDEDFSSISRWNWSITSTRYYLYAHRRDGRRLVKMHRFILSAPTNKVVDHINGNGLDNRKINLRLCSPAENARNQRKHKNNVSGFRGVSWCKREKKWVAYVAKDGVKKFVGYFKNKKLAALARDQKATSLHGEFAKLNF